MVELCSLTELLKESSEQATPISKSNCRCRYTPIRSKWEVTPVTCLCERGFSSLSEYYSDCALLSPLLLYSCCSDPIIDYTPVNTVM